MSIAMIGLDTAKSVFQVHAVDEAGTTEVRRKLRRSELIMFFEKQEACTVVMEACGAAHHWARVLIGLGHEVKLVAPEAIKPFVIFDFRQHDLPMRNQDVVEFIGEPRILNGSPGELEVDRGLPPHMRPSSRGPRVRRTIRADDQFEEPVPKASQAFGPYHRKTSPPHVDEDCQVCNAPGDRPGMVEAVCDGKDPLDRNSAEEWLTSGNATERGRAGDRSAGLRPDRPPGTCPWRRPRPSRWKKHLRSPLKVPRVAGDRRVEAGELRRDRLPEDDGACIPQAGNERRIALGDCLREKLRARPRRPAGDVDQILDPDGNPVQGSPPSTGLGVFIQFQRPDSHPSRSTRTQA